ncbi:MAG TPA: hypothetical protein VEN95_10600 [Actinomycetota bacterium]|nr:hypothetical protein [Actinomycetota bacterium]
MDRKLAGLGVAVMLLIGGVQGGIATAAAACPRPLPQGSDPVTLDPADFVAQIDNPYLSFPRGARWVYRETDPQGSSQKVRVTVTTHAKQILGIDATVVHDVVTEKGHLVENTFDWYAQDTCGSVWYLGENTKEYENGKVVSTAGSWEAGVDGAQPGVVMPADRQVGLAYRQEYYAGEAEDNAEILSLVEQAQVPFGHFRDVVLTKETTPLERRVLEYKLYAKGIGVVLAISVSGGSDREELVRFTPASA